jgi:hypothetical protein
MTSIVTNALKIEIVTREEVCIVGSRKCVYEVTSIYEPDMERMKAAVKVLLNSKKGTK